MASRHDLVEVSEPRIDQNGYLVVDAFPTRTGVFKYVKPDGTITRELRHHDDVFKPESLETLKHRPIIDEHPDGGPADSRNTKSLSVGHVGEQVSQADSHVKANLIVTDARMIEKITGGGGAKPRKLELSCGYSADVVEDSGIYRGEKFDHRQTNIVYNHLACVRKGRAGPTARIHLDSEDAVIEGLSVDSDHPNNPGGKEKELSAMIKKLMDEGKPQDQAIAIAHEKLGISRKKDTEDIMTIKRKLEAVSHGDFRQDAIEITYDKETESTVDALVNRLDQSNAHIKVLQDKYEGEEGARKKAEGERDQTKDELAKAKKDDGIDPVKLDEMAAERADVLGVAGHKGIKDIVGKSNDQLKAAVVQIDNPKLKMDAMDAMIIEGRYGAICDGIMKETKGLQSLAQLRKTTTADPKNDADPDKVTPSPRAKLMQDQASMHGKTEAEVKQDWAKTA